MFTLTIPLSMLCNIVDLYHYVYFTQSMLCNIVDLYHYVYFTQSEATSI